MPLFSLKALPMWLNTIVVNETLLKRYYCEDAFVRQCRSGGQRGLHADLMTHLEQLLVFPFHIDLAQEARRASIEANGIGSTTGANPVNGVQHSQRSNQNQHRHSNKHHQASHGQTQKPKPVPKRTHQTRPTVLQSPRLHSATVVALPNQPPPPGAPAGQQVMTSEQPHTQALTSHVVLPNSYLPLKAKHDIKGLSHTQVS
ncbi:unnamed protein product [Protopolystoma xenopodis]|uniref:RUN domain-containing protein n=1 Tax=Protopolystoma xenopodis TaxID=117903 RepID=A0A448X4I9_9PLAT|nr:unnamed protein product [Protopolystoma xenopodis]